MTPTSEGAAIAHERTLTGFLLALVAIDRLDRLGVISYPVRQHLYDLVFVLLVVLGVDLARLRRVARGHDVARLALIAVVGVTSLLTVLAHLSSDPGIGRHFLRLALAGVYFLQPGRWAAQEESFRRLAIVLLPLQLVWLGLDGDIEGPWLEGRFRGSFVHPNVTGATFALLAAPFVVSSASIRPWLRGGALAGIVAVVAATRSRTAMAILAVVFACGGLRFVRGRRVVLAMSLAVGLLGLAVGSQWLRRGQRLEELMTLTDRTELWRQAWPDVLERPIVGWGDSSASLRIWSPYSRQYWETPSEHNFFLFVARRGGLPQAVALTAAFGFGLATAALEARRRRMATARLALVLALALLMISESVLGERGGLVAVLFCWVLARGFHDAGPVPAKRPADSRVGRGEGAVTV